MSNLKAQWIRHCLDACHRAETLYSGCRKIISPVTLKFTKLDDSLTIQDCGFTKSKITMLTKNYLHEESRKVAVELWAKRRGQDKYGSVGFTTYAHFVKGGSIDAKRSKRASVFGPCIQSVVITYINKKTYTIDIFYRTTELLKKFPADLVFLRDVLLTPFDLSGMKMSHLTCHFANVTVHVMYWVTIIPHLEDPLGELRKIKKTDEYFHNWVVKWTARYVCPEYHRGIAKFAQALRVQMDAKNRIDKGTMKSLQKYLRDNHIGYRGDKKEEDEDDPE